jgi:hypothetical protein
MTLLNFVLQSFYCQKKNTFCGLDMMLLESKCQFGCCGEQRNSNTCWKIVAVVTSYAEPHKGIPFASLHLKTFS